MTSSPAFDSPTHWRGIRFVDEISVSKIMKGVMQMFGEILKKRHRLTTSLCCVLFGLLLNTGCAVSGRRTVVVVEDDYEPLYYESRVVYFDDFGAPYYYVGGVVTYVPRSYPRYNVYVTYHRQHRTGYQRWHRHHGHHRPAPANNPVRQNRPAPPPSNARPPAPRNTPSGNRGRRR